MKRRKILVLALLMGAAFTISAQKVTLNYQNQKLEKVLSGITEQTGLSLAYSSRFVDLKKEVSISVTSEELSDVLDRLLGDTRIGYEIRERDIFLFDKNERQKENGGVSSVSRRIVTGKVTDMKGEVIIGANVLVKGTTNGTVTDIDGNFSIANVSDNDWLQVSYIGYLPQDVTTRGQRALSITLKEDSQSLDEVVVIGYGTTTVKSATGSISSVKSDEIKNYPSTNFASSLSGKMTGVQIGLPQGVPGNSPVIKIRGTGTLTAGSDPLIVVDGFPLTEGSSINSINQNAIQSIEVLKDAASTAIYGSRGANGIIMITTKNGKNTKPNVSLSANFGIQQRYDKLKLVDAYDMAQYLYEARNTGYVNKDPLHRSETDNANVRKQNGASKRELIPDYLLPYLNRQSGLTNTNWLDEIFQAAPIQDYNVSVNGGSDKAFYSFSAGYMKQDGIIIGSDYEKISANVNLKLMPTKSINLGLSFSPTYAHEETFDVNGGSNGNYLQMAMIMYPFFSPYNEDGSLAVSKQIEANTATDGALAENPVAYQQMTKYGKNNPRMFGNVYADVTFFDDFTFKTSLGADYESSVYNFFKPSDLGGYRAAAPQPATATKTTLSRANYVIENTLTYNKLYKDHSIQFLLGQSYQKEDQESLKVVATDFADNSITNIAGGSSFKLTPSQYSWSMISYFSRLNYSFDNKYLFSASIRRDGSSRFGSDTKWGLFPAVSGGWLISSEDFMRDNAAIEYTKLRVSWGKSGNNQIPNYGAMALMSGDDYLFDGNLASGSVISSSPNPNLSWEISSTWNVGLDAILFQYLGINADFYVANTRDLLLEVPVPQQSGYINSLQNIGEVRNTGFELRLSTAKDVNFGAVSWNSSLNMSTNKSKVQALAPGQTQIIGSKGFSITKVGGSISELYGYDVTGIYKTEDELKSLPTMAGTQIGDYIIRDVNEDGIIDTKDKKSFGSPAPKVILGWNNTFRYKNFELTLDLYGELGKKIYSQVLSTYLNVGEGFSMASQDYFDNRYHPVNNPEGTYATPNMGNFSNARKESRVSNKFFYNASYLNVRNLKVAYDIPVTFLHKLGIERAQAYVLANNLLMLTPYKGMSVDANTTDALNQGLDSFNYPVPRTFSLGLNVNF
ncbi:TonB-dependent receptor [Parabacteroides sp.]